MMYMIGIFIICVFLSISLYGYLNKKTKIAEIFLLMAIMFFVFVLAVFGLTKNLAEMPSYSEELISEIVKEKPVLTKEELSGLSNENLRKLLSKIREDKEAKIMREVIEKIDIDDTESMRAIPQRIEF